MIKAEHISKSFDGRAVLDDISVTFDTGKTNLIIGRSGSGKTVLLKSLVGLHAVDSGAIYYDDICYTSLGFKERKAIRKDIGMIFQGGGAARLVDRGGECQAAARSVYLPLGGGKMERVKFCLDRVKLTGADRLYPSELSGGMIKRVAIARAIVLNPRYLFCDEPNSGLDPKTSILIDELLSDITHEYGITTVINTHDMNSVLGIGENIIFINKGHREWVGNMSQIYNTANDDLNDFVFATRLFQQVRRYVAKHGTIENDAK